MSTKRFCDICDNETKNDEVVIWSSPMKNYCRKCWINKRNWPKIHSIDKK